ncbi:MAG TPA: T9SS type A sorting domain-containing protein, partial [Bacteroidia bacterium]|nr:T9SS type A sorting domain-containing protein [Bacteroidia bacterium]
QGTTTIVVNFNATAANRTLKVVANNACGASSAKTLVVAVAVCPSAREGSLSELSNVEVYPNPSKGLLSVNFNSISADNYLLTVSDLSGRVLRMIPVSAVEGENKVNLELTDVSTGVYVLTLKGNSDVSQTRIVIE